MPRLRNCPERASSGGFTLIELVVTVAVIAIVALVAVPGLQAMISNGRVSGLAGEMTASLQLARSEAVRRNAPVTVCRTTNGTTCAAGTSWGRWIVIGNDNAAGTTDVIRDNTAPDATQVSGPSGGIRFNPSGLIEAQATLTVCAPSSSSQNQRVITVLVSGYVSTANASGACT